MAALDASLYYSVGCGIILAIVYAVSHLQFENISTKIRLALRKSQKGGLEEHTTSRGTAGAADAVITPKISPSWWNEEEIFQLERRAIFSKTWLFVTHATKFENPGDYRTFEVAGFPFIVILGKDRQIRAFHNVCRHRAYAVTNKECGSSTVLRCRYHGWSYDSRGKLIKAPEFEGVKGFEKDLNGLWEVKTEIRESMIFVNLDVGNEVTSQVLSDGEGNLRRWKTNDMSWIEEWKLEGRFNWKLAAGFLLPSNSGREGLSSFLSFGSSDEYLNMFHTTVFRRLRSGQLLTLRLLPLSRNTTRIECNLYGTGSRTNRNRVDNLKMEIQFTIEQLEFRQHTLMHNGSDYSDSHQTKLGEILRYHKAAEGKLGAEIHPAARKQSFTQEGREDDDLCREIEDNLSRKVSLCSANANGLLDW